MAKTAAGKGHFNELDIMKGIGIWAVVIGHLQPDKPAVTVIYSVHMFLFFFCSGFLGERYKDRHYGEVLWGNVKRLLFPYAIWGIISQAYELILGYQTFDQAVKRFFFIGKWVGWNAPLWFFIVLFWVEIIGYLAVRLPILVKVVLMGISAWAWYYISTQGYALWFGLRIVPIGLFFWLLGLVIRELYEKPSFKKMLSKWWQLLIALIPLLAAWILLGVVYNDTISVYHVTYSNYPFTLIAGMAGTVFLLLFCRLIDMTKVVNLIGKFFAVYGKNSLFILCSHHFFLRGLQHFSKLYMGKNLWLTVDTWKAFRIGTELMLLYFVLILLLRPLKKKGFMKYLI